jgi:hypothetical protein
MSKIEGERKKEQEKRAKKKKRAAKQTIKKVKAVFLILRI